MVVQQVLPKTLDFDNANENVRLYYVQFGREKLSCNFYKPVEMLRCTVILPHIPGYHIFINTCYSDVNSGEPE